MYRNYYSSYGSDNTTEFIIMIVILIILLIGKIGTSIHDSNMWNNGYCSCGGQWQYEQAVGHRYDTNYIYKCDKCGKVHEFEEYR